MARLPTPEMPPLVVARRDVTQEVWNAFAAALEEEFPDLTAREKYIYMMLFGVEGGLRVGDKGTASGIDPGMLQAMIGQGKFTPDHSITGPADLTFNDRARFYRAYFDEVLGRFGGHSIFSRLGDDKTAAAVADIAFQYTPGGAEWVYQHGLSLWNLGSVSSQKPGGMSKETWNNILTVTAQPTKLAGFRSAMATARERLFPAGKGNEHQGMNRYTTFR
ncbi:MAG: hypothetical protein HQL51_02010 [Magnetococcales bacterium]|nr:hypothetical protein [Magnetococcales bacterium]